MILQSWYEMANRVPGKTALKARRLHDKFSFGTSLLGHHIAMMTTSRTGQNITGSDILVRKLILVRVLIQFDKNNFSLVLVRQKMKILVLVQF